MLITSKLKALKKLLTCVAIATFSTFGFAQKQDQGDLQLEMEFSPLGANPIKISSLKARYFANEGMAYRMGVFMGGTKTPTTVIENNIELSSTSSSFDLNLRPGFEKHFEGSNKLSPYCGSELAFTVAKTGSKDESLWFSNQAQIKTQKTKSSTTSLGLNVFSGADFYLSEKLYMGVEIGFGFMFDGKGKTSVSWKNPEDSSEVSSETVGNSTNIQWGPNYQGTIRLGYCLKNVRK